MIKHINLNASFMNAKFFFNAALILIIVFGVSCNNPFNTNGETVEIRITNSSHLPMGDILVSFPEKDVNYGNLAPGESSSYQTISKAYRHAYVELIIDDKLVRLVPNDYVGESYLEKGSYTYILSLHYGGVHEDYPEYSPYSLSLELEKDR